MMQNNKITSRDFVLLLSVAIIFIGCGIIIYYVVVDTVSECTRDPLAYAGKIHEDRHDAYIYGQMDAFNKADGSYILSIKFNSSGIIR